MKEKSKVKIIVTIIGAAGTLITGIAMIVSSLLSKGTVITINNNPNSQSIYETSKPTNNGEQLSNEGYISTYSSFGSNSVNDESNSVDSIKTTSSVINDAPTEIILYADNQYGKWGYVDQFRKEIIPHIYEWADDFIDEYAAVCKNSSCGFISSTGEVVIPFTYVAAWSFIDGLAPVFNGDKWGFIDKQGNVKIPFKFVNIYRTYDGGNQVYTDENNNVIIYAHEINHANAFESDSIASKNTTHSSSEPTDKPSSIRSIPMRDYLQPYVSATIDKSELRITINKGQADQRNEKNTYPFRWGVHLESDKTNDYVLALELCIGSDGSVIETNATAYIITGSNSMEQVQENFTKIQAYLDNDKYILSCNIANDYIPLDDMCINTLFHYY